MIFTLQLIYAPDPTDIEPYYELSAGLNTIGRSLGNGSAIKDNSLSRRHAEITITQNRAKVKDLGSLNGTFVNDIQTEEGELRNGDTVRFGAVEFKFTAKQGQESLISQDFPLAIVKQFSPDQDHSVLADLVPNQKIEGSILKLPSELTEQRTVEKLKILLEVSKQLCSPDELDIMLTKILDLLFNIMAIDRAIILLVDEESQELEPKAVKLREGTPSEEKFYSKKITNLAYQNAEIILCSDASIDARFKGLDSKTDSILLQAIHAAMCVPLKPHNQVIGVLYVDNLSMNAVYSDEDLEFLSALANQAAVAIHMAREFQKREQALKQQVEELKIQIDQSKKEREVEEIVGSDYFQELQQRAERLRKKAD